MAYLTYEWSAKNGTDTEREKLGANLGTVGYKITYFTNLYAFGISEHKGSTKYMSASAIMNGMTNKERKRKIELLKQYTDFEKSIQDLKDRYEELYTASTKITPSYSETSGFGGGFDGSKVENNCIKLLEISQKIDRAEERKRQIDQKYKINVIYSAKSSPVCRHRTSFCIPICEAT